jgi:hypothetical protein
MRRVLVVTLWLVVILSIATPSSATPRVIRVNPPQVAFGATTVGELSAPREIRWTNTGDLPIQIFNWVLAPNFEF